MSIIVREIKSEEIGKVQKMGRRAFFGFESLWVSKPTTALVAVQDDIIVGCMIYKIFDSGNKKVGYVDHMFVHSDYHGQGVGNVLYKKGIEFLWSLGCDALTALVKDDNVASWSLLLKNGFQRTSFGEGTKVFGIPSMIKQYFSIPFFVGIGMDYYLALNPSQAETQSTNNIKEILTFIAVNCAILIPSFLKISNIPVFLLSYIFILLGSVLLGYIATIFSKQNWKFRFTNGGAFVCFVFNFVTLYPMIGNWYPSEYKTSTEFKKDMGINALLQWIFLLVMSSITFISSTTNIFINYTAQIAQFLLLYKCIPIFPFESFGGKRVFEWNKIVFFIMAILSILTFIF